MPCAERFYFDCLNKDIYIHLEKYADVTAFTNKDGLVKNHKYELTHGVQYKISKDLGIKKNNKLQLSFVLNVA